MAGRWSRNAAVVVMAISIVSSVSTFWLSNLAERRDRELGQHNRDLALVQGVAISCGRATRLAADCTLGVSRLPEELHRAHQSCEAAWDGLRGGVSPDFAPRLRELETVAQPLRSAVGAVTAQCIGGGAQQETVTALAEAEAAFEPGMNAVIQAAEERSRAARIGWDRTHRQIEGVSVLTGLWALAIAVTLGLMLRRMFQTREALVTEKFRAEELDAFASRAAHDLRGLLTPLPLIASAIMRAGDDSQRLESLARRLEGTSRRANRMIDALLAFARVGHAPNPVSAPVSVVLAEVLMDLEPMVLSVGAEVRIQGARGRVRMEGPLLYAVLMNLISNALKFMRGRPRRLVTVKTRARDEMLELVVEDTGPGIPAHELSRVFERFYRAKTLEPAPGAGIGLASVSRLVVAHGGRADIESVEGKGTRVIILLPLAESPGRERTWGAPVEPGEADQHADS